MSEERVDADGGLVPHLSGPADEVRRLVRAIGRSAVGGHRRGGDSVAGCSSNDAACPNWRRVSARRLRHDVFRSTAFRLHPDRLPDHRRGTDQDSLAQGHAGLCVAGARAVSGQAGKTGAFPRPRAARRATLARVPSSRSSLALTDDTQRVSALPLSSTMPNCSTSPAALGNWPTISPLRSSLATERRGWQVGNQRIDLAVAQRHLRVAVGVVYLDRDRRRPPTIAAV